MSIKKQDVVVSNKASNKEKNTVEKLAAKIQAMAEKAVVKVNTARNQIVVKYNNKVLASNNLTMDNIELVPISITVSGKRKKIKEVTYRVQRKEL